MHILDTPKTSGSSSAGPRRLSMSDAYKRSGGGGPYISSPLATSSPMVPCIVSADRPQRRPPLLPITKQPNQFAPFNINDAVQQQQRQQQAGSRTNTIRSADLSSLFTTPEEAAFDHKHTEILQSIQAQRDLVEQAAAAIAFCRKKYSYNGTLQELSAQRLLLVSQERLTLFNRQMDEIKDQRFESNKNNLTIHLADIPEGDDFDNEESEDNPDASIVGASSINARSLLYCLLIDKLVIQLNPSFSLKKLDKESSYAFIVLCRHDNCVHATQVANVLDIGELRNNKVKIKELIVFDNLPYGFCVMVEVFAMRIGKRLDHKWQSVWDFAARTFRSLKRTFSSSPNIDASIDRRNNSKTLNKGVAAPAGMSFSASSVLTQQQTPLISEFRRCGYLHLNRDSLGLGKEKFFLSDANYPLEGSIDVYARFSPTNTPIEPPRPDSADRDLRIAGCTMSTSNGVMQ